MDKKPKITDDRQLVDALNRYRQQLCCENSSLDGRLRSGKMKKSSFSQLTGQFELLLFDAYGVLNRGSTKIDWGS